MTRRVTIHNGRTHDNEELQVVIIYEEGINKECARRENVFTKRHQVLIRNGEVYDYLKK